MGVGVVVQPEHEHHGLQQGLVQRLVLQLAVQPVVAKRQQPDILASINIRSRGTNCKLTDPESEVREFC